MASGKAAAFVEENLKGFLEENGLYLWDVAFVKEGPDYFLRVFIDREEGGVSTDDCELVSKFLSDRLDAADPIPQNYYLEVSSPGMDRKLTRPEHYERCMGELVEVKLYEPFEGSRKLTARLKGFDGQNVTLAREEEKKSGNGDTFVIPLKNIAGINLAITF
ncbi:MAG: ribosome maturation factor RimP [Eubacterium sp.]|jgi:ribosome maturation factor RimP